MQKKIYSIPAKIAAAVLLIVSLFAAGYGGFHGLVAAYVGCYYTDDSMEPTCYESGLCWNEAHKYVQNAEEWYTLSQKQSDLGYVERERYAQLTEQLQQSSLCAVRVSSSAEGEKQEPVAGKPVRDSFLKFSYIMLYESENGELGYQTYIDESAGYTDIFAHSRETYQKLYPRRWGFVSIAGVGALIALASWFFLLATAGRSAATGEIVLKGIHRIPFDLLTLVFFFAGGMPVSVIEESGWPGSWEMLNMMAALIVATILAAVFLVMLWVHTLAARIKAKRLWSGTVIGMVCIKAWNMLRSGVGHAAAAGQKAAASRREKEAEDGAEALGRWSKAKQQLGKIDWRHNKVTALFSAVGRGLRAAIRQIKELIRHINVIWKLCGGVAIIVFLLEITAASMNSGGIFLLLLILDLLVFFAVGFFAIQLDRLKKGGERLAGGDLDYKIPTDHMYWDLQQHAKNLNAISDGMAVAVEERLKSERMKYELLTNVSHDIKTPLTSIINYVDLLGNEPVGSEQAKEYIAVLERQSAKLKKLITDLIEVSKATTGNITVHAERTHAGELLRQCVGEYSGRLEEKKLETVLTVPEKEPSIFADGRLLWRVFDNLLGNIVKYAMPGTRVYLDLETNGNRVIISLRNISRERLNVAPDELMERFVRGDISRATEGSGLGLSIARSLTELMRGQFSLMVDGDLFKIVLSFDKMTEE